MAIVTTRWSDFSWKPGESASITFDVSGVGLYNHDAVAAAFAPGVFQANDTCPWDTTLVANQPDVSRVGPDFWVIKCTFSNVAGGSKPPKEPNPLDEPPKIKWSFSNTSEEFNRDIHGNPFTNANHDPFQTPFQNEFLEVEFTITRNFALFDANINQHAGKINDAEVTLMDDLTYVFAEKTLRFIVANPTIEYDHRATYIPVAAIFKWRPDGWRVRRKNEGRNGFWNDDGTTTWGAFCDKFGQPLSEDTPLNLDGTPFDATIVVTTDRKAPVASPYPIPDEVEYEISDDGTIFLLFDRCKLVSFTSIPF